MKRISFLLFVVISFVVYSCSKSKTATTPTCPTPSVGTINGANSINVGFTTTLSENINGGRWTSSNTAVATIGSSTGIVTGVDTGTATLTYSIADNCAAIYSITVNSTPPTANLMFFNGCVSGAIQNNLDGKVNNATIIGATNIAIKKSSNYLAVTAGTVDSISFFLTGLSYLIGGTMTLTLNTNYSAFVGGQINAPSFIILADDLTAPATGKAKVRFVNLSPDNLNENCYIGSVKVDSNICYKTASPFLQVAAATTSLLIQDISKPIEVLSGTNITFMAGRIYTIVITGTATGYGTSALVYTILNNN